jgi:ligand-binding SRPBCC domain-containing protein
MAFHAEPDALRRLAMPPTFIQVVRDGRTSLIEGEIEFNLWIGPLPLRWLARHEPGPIDTSFADRMVRGPMAAWRHEHIFEPVQQGTLLVDRIAFEHRPGLAGLFTRLLFDGLPLRVLFMYRHWRTRRAL